MKRILLGCAALVAAVACGEVKLAAPFADGMVLQRERPIRVWGTADAGESVRVAFAGTEATTTADAAGRWLVELPAQPASRESRELTAGAQVVRDVLVGEVWFCSGQSNTDCPIWGPNPRYRDGQGALALQMTRRPDVRLVKTPLVWEPTPQTACKVEWQKMTPQMFADFEKNGSRLPSAMGWYFARELSYALDVPIGLVDSSWGGTNIDAWTPPSGHETVPELNDVASLPSLSERDYSVARTNGVYKGLALYGRAVHQPRVLWNAMVAPYVPMSIRGFIWYQGCTNAREPERYAAKMHALYNGWAKEFRNPELSLYFAQLAPWGMPTVSEIQMAQAKFAAEEPHAALAVIGDVGNLKDIHPNDKRTVARRLAAHALRRDYGWDWVRDESPVFTGAKVADGKVTLSFANVQSWYVYNPDRSLTTGFELCGEDGVWKAAKLENAHGKKDRTGKVQYRGDLVGREVVISAPGLTAPKKVRYLHSEPWFASLYNESTLPLGPFAADL